MKVLSSISSFREARRRMGDTVGLVPTMGYLHEGHLVLVRRAKAENETAVVSIFVNPTQFGPKEDFARYPRDPERDLTLLDKEGTDLVFMPDAEEMYHRGFATWVDVEKVTERLEGSTRPGHFRGVATVVAKLFNIVEPTAAYFGEKDAQQVVVIKRMVADLNMNLNVVVVPTHREPDGLAMSSRNVYLNTEERQAALILWKSLSLARQLWSEQEVRPESVKQQMAALIQEEPLARIDYISIANPETLEELAEISHAALLSLAVYIGKTRLIDNITISS
jgi:pantoate--beta-alanine ligase